MSSSEADRAELDGPSSSGDPCVNIAQSGAGPTILCRHERGTNSGRTSMQPILIRGTSSQYNICRLSLSTTFESFSSRETVSG
jgi:hypothetical protein